MDDRGFEIVLEKVPQADQEGEGIRECIEDVRMLEPEMDDVAELRRAATEVGPRDSRIFTRT